MSDLRKEELDSSNETPLDTSFFVKDGKLTEGGFMLVSFLCIEITRRVIGSVLGYERKEG